MTERQKIGVACAVGGGIGAVVALVVAVPLWWLGLLAGFSGGYVSYEFRAVLRAIPEAWRMTVIAMRGTASFLVDVVVGGGKVVWAFVQWFVAPHPYFHTATTFGFVSALFLCLKGAPPSAGVVELTTMGLLCWLIGMLIALMVIPFFVAMGASSKERRSTILRAFYNDREDPYFVMFPVTRVERMLKLTYREVAWSGIRGIALLLTVFPIKLVPILIVGVAKGIAWSARFAWNFTGTLIRLIHSDKRLLCGVDAAIGTGVAYVTLARPEMTVPQHLLVIAAGAMVGAALGILNYEVVSKRLLHLNGAEAQ